jgi:hypothetical protein
MTTTGPLQQHYSRSTRRAVCAVARSLGIEPDEYLTRPGDPAENMGRLWGECAQRMAGGVASASEQIIGDPFVVVLAGICQQDHQGRGPFEQHYIVKTDRRVDEHEGEQIIARLKAEPDVGKCEACGGAITTWQSDHCRLSVFQEAYKVTGADLHGRQRGPLSPIVVTTDDATPTGMEAPTP